MKIPAITIWQPWASLIAVGAKKYETRSWPTKYRGQIAIHAAVTPFRRIMKKVFPLHEWSYAPDYTAKRKFVDLVSKFVDIDNLAYGAVIAVADLVGCWQIASCTGTYGTGYGYVSIGKDGGLIFSPSSDEMHFGNWTPGRYAWELANVRMLAEPIPAKGRQGLWLWDMPKT